MIGMAKARAAAHGPLHDSRRRKFRLRMSPRPLIASRDKKRAPVGRCQFGRSQLQFFANLGCIDFETPISIHNFRAARHVFPMGEVGQPIAQFHNRSRRVATVRVNVLAGDVRYGRTVAVGFTIEHKASLIELLLASKTLASEIQPEFQRHVEAR